MVVQWACDVELLPGGDWRHLCAIAFVRHAALRVAVQVVLLAIGCRECYSLL
jgi:hypothetical protein